MYLKLTVFIMLVCTICCASIAFAADSQQIDQNSVLLINGQSVSKDDYISRLETVQVQTPQGPKLGRQLVMDQLINEVLMLQLANKLQVAPTDEQINNRIELIKKESNGNLDKMLAGYGMTIDDLKRRLNLDQAVINIITRGITVSDDLVKAEYNKIMLMPKSPYKVPAQAHALLIVSKTKSKIDAAYKMLTSKGDALAVSAKYSDAKDNKYIWIAKDDPNQEKIVIDNAFALGANKFSKPFKMKDSWVVVFTQEKKPEIIASFDDVKADLKEQISIKEGSAKNNIQGEYKKFVLESNIVVSSDKYKDIIDTLKKNASANDTVEPAPVVPQQ